MADVAFETSGSTGAAKTVVRREDQLLADAQNLLRVFPDIWGQTPVVVASIRAEHLYGALWRVRAPALAGCRVEDAVVFSVEELLAARARCGRFLFVTTPSFLEKALLHGDFPKLHGAFSAIVTSGAALRRETALAVAEVVGVCPHEIYGSTETGTIAWRRACDGETFSLVAGVAARPLADGRLEVDSPFAMTRPMAMGDLVAFVSPRTFRLFGRADRRVKILEQYVALDAVERALSGHPQVASVRVEAYGADVPRLGALVVLAPEGVAEAARKGFKGVTVALRAFLRERLPDRAIPRRIRFVRALPVDERGKTTVAAVQSALGAWCREPVVTEWSATAERLLATLVFPPDCECFRGHFPGIPILPGVAQLYFLRHFARQAFRDFPDVATYRRLKFQKLVLPSRPVTLRVERRGAGTFDFSFAGASGPCSSGQIMGASS